MMILDQGTMQSSIKKELLSWQHQTKDFEKNGPRSKTTFGGGNIKLYAIIMHELFFRL